MLARMRLTSSAFTEGASIPAKYTCDGGDTIPPLAFEDVPENAAVLALVMDDPDAPRGTWDHWVVWNIPRDTKGVREGSEPPGVLGSRTPLLLPPLRARPGARRSGRIDEGTARSGDARTRHRRSAADGALQPAAKPVIIFS
jgi:hypothetical protein